MPPSPAPVPVKSILSKLSVAPLVTSIPAFNVTSEIFNTIPSFIVNKYLPEIPSLRLDVV